LITRYAKRMLIENALADAMQFFHIDALSSSAQARHLVERLAPALRRVEKG
jgi:hypothetical protein